MASRSRYLNIHAAQAVRFRHISPSFPHKEKFPESSVKYIGGKNVIGMNPPVDPKTWSYTASSLSLGGVGVYTSAPMRFWEYKTTLNKIFQSSGSFPSAITATINSTNVTIPATNNTSLHFTPALLASVVKPVPYNVPINPCPYLFTVSKSPAVTTSPYEYNDDKVEVFEDDENENALILAYGS